MTKCGFIAVIGAPNVGKSTLLNTLIGQKLNLVSHKANATRKRQKIIHSTDKVQMIFVDTPGLHKREKLLNQFMLKEALKAIEDCDLILFLVDARAGKSSLEQYKQFLTYNEKNIKHFIILNKIDLLKKDELLMQIAQFNHFSDHFSELISISAIKALDKNLLKQITKYLPKSPFLYEEDLLSTNTNAQIYKELIREALFNLTSNEIPYESDVQIEAIKIKNNMNYIYANIIVSSDSQKAIVIGKNGLSIKRISKAARTYIESMLGELICLFLRVKTIKNWSKKEQHLKNLGYGL